MMTLALAGLVALASAQSEELKAELERLKAEAVAKAVRIAELQRQLDKEKADQKAFRDQTQSQLDRIRELTDQVEELRKKVAPAPKGAAVPPVAPAPVVPASPPAIPLVKPAPAASATPYGTFYNLPKSLEGKVTAVANEIGLLVLSVGKDDGVEEGDEFTITRGGDFVAKVKIDRADRKWSAGKVTLKKSDPRVADDAVKEHVHRSVEKAALQALGKIAQGPAVPADEIRRLRKELDEVRSQVRELSDRLLPAWQDAGVSADEAPDDLRTHLGILRGLVVRRVREGSPAEKAGLKTSDVIPDLLEAQVLEAIRIGAPLNIIRKGQPLKLAGK